MSGTIHTGTLHDSQAKPARCTVCNLAKPAHRTTCNPDRGQHVPAYDGKDPRRFRTLSPSHRIVGEAGRRRTPSGGRRTPRVLPLPSPMKRGCRWLPIRGVTPIRRRRQGVSSAGGASAYLGSSERFDCETCEFGHHQHSRVTLLTIVREVVLVFSTKIARQFWFQVDESCARHRFFVMGASISCAFQTKFITFALQLDRIVAGGFALNSSPHGHRSLLFCPVPAFIVSTLPVCFVGWFV